MLPAEHSCNLYEALQDLRSSNKDSLEFLQDSAVDSEPFYAKLYAIVKLHVAILPLLAPVE